MDAPPAKLYVLNSVEEFVSNVALSWIYSETKLVVTSYVRDPAILGPTYTLKGTIRPASEVDENKLSSFLHYLQGRQKVENCGLLLDKSND
jgi:hypothetical protein